MINKEAKIRTSDNSDAQVVMCIHSNKKRHKCKKTSLGNFIKGTIKRRIYRRNVLKKRVNWILIGATRRKIQRLSGESVQFNSIKAIVVDEKKSKVMGSRIKGVLPKELRRYKLNDIIFKARRLV
jgi:ribosomal protein L14